MLKGLTKCERLEGSKCCWKNNTENLLDTVQLLCILCQEFWPCQISLFICLWNSFTCYSFIFTQAIDVYLNVIIFIFMAFISYKILLPNKIENIFYCILHLLNSPEFLLQNSGDCNIHLNTLQLLFSELSKWWMRALLQ